MSTVTDIEKTILGEVADALLADLETPAVQAAILAFVQKEEGYLPGLVATAIKGLPKPGGILGTVLPTLESEVGKYAAQIVAKFPASDIVAWLTLLAKKEVAQLGG